MKKARNIVAVALAIFMTSAIADPTYSFDVAEPAFSFVRGELEGEKSRALVQVTNPNAFPIELVKFSCVITIENNTSQYIEHPQAWLNSLGSKGSETVWLELYGKPPSVPTGAECTLHEFKLMWTRR